MTHEQSETVQLPDGRWANVYGQGLPRAGQQLPGSETYASVDDAVRAARARSERAGMLPYFYPPPPAQGDLLHYLKLRNALPPDSPLHAVLGPLEHGQFAEESVRDNPLMALPLMFAIPGYTAAKATGLVRGTRSPASWDEIFEGYAGMLRGLRPQR